MSRRRPSAALTAYRRHERDVFSLRAGVAVEHLVKGTPEVVHPARTSTRGQWVFQ